VRFIRLIRGNRPDLSQAFLFHANLLAALFYPCFRVPVIGGFRVNDPRAWRVWLSRLAACQMQKVVCVSQAVADECARRERIPLDKLVVIPNGIDVDAVTSESSHQETVLPFDRWPRSTYAQEQLGISETTPALLFVGRFDHQKGIDVILSKADELLTQLPLHHLILLGDGPLKVDMQCLASRSPHEQRIHFAGQRDDVLKWMQSCQLLLLPTRYEGMPNVVLEAMASGLPIVTSRAEGILELLGEAADSQTVAVGDWEAWVQRVMKLACEPNLLRRLSLENHARCVEYFELHDKLERYEQLYATILAKSMAGSPTID
jgi:glycosyltransferase involved in cell wall biosynthesis